jgi:hypothetical protein
MGHVTAWGPAGRRARGWCFDCGWTAAHESLDAVIGQCDVHERATGVRRDAAGFRMDTIAPTESAVEYQQPRLPRLMGCTCGGIGDTGSHSRGCPWGRR